MPGYEVISTGVRWVYRGTKVLVPGYENIPRYEGTRIYRGTRVLVPGYECISAGVRGFKS